MCVVCVCVRVRAHGRAHAILLVCCDVVACVPSASGQTCVATHPCSQPAPSAGLQALSHGIMLGIRRSTVSALLPLLLRGTKRVNTPGCSSLPAKIARTTAGYRSIASLQRNESRLLSRRRGVGATAKPKRLLHPTKQSPKESRRRLSGRLGVGDGGTAGHAPRLAAVPVPEKKSKPEKSKLWLAGRGVGVHLLGSGKEKNTDEDQSAISLLGSVAESNADHKRRHPRVHAACARCMYEQNRVSLESHHGSFDTPGGQHGHRTVWLAPRPSRMGGQWGLGCVCCARLLERNQTAFDKARQAGQAHAKATKRGAQWANTKWSRFEVRQVSQVAARGVRQHEGTLQHRRAVRAMYAPPDVDARTVLDADDAELFRGGVPQPCHWIQAWSSCSAPVSFRGAENQSSVVNFLSGRRGRAVGRKAFAAMVRVMAFVLRLRKRVRLRAATVISIGLDDRGPFRLITYRCDTPCPQSGDAAISEWTGWASGCLGVLRKGGDASTKKLEDTDGDYSKLMADSVVRAFRRVATDMNGNCDETALTWMLNAVRIGVADGAASAQKSLRFLAAGPCPNMLAISRDIAHLVRIATRDPLLAVKDFDKWWADVFDKKDSLIPEIQNSEEWTEKLLMCQRAVLGSRGEMGAGLKVAQRCVHFAKQRFDSISSPMQQYCCMLPAIAMLLAYVASDHRRKPSVRDRARRRLEEMPRLVPTAGLIASYAEEAIRFVRRFDKGHHDPALIWRHVGEFTKRMRLLFQDGHIWSASGSADAAEKTLLETVMREAQDAPTIYYDDEGRVLRLYRAPTRPEALQLQAGCHQATEAMCDRIDAELSLDHPLVLLTSFDLMRWLAAFAAARAGDELSLDALRRHTRLMFALWQLSSDANTAQLEGVAARLVERNRTAIESGNVEDYRTIWVQALRPDFGINVSRVHVVIRIYMAALDGTCGVERDLGSLRRVLDAHAGPLDEDGCTISHCMDVFLDGPASRNEVAMGPQGVVESGGCDNIILLPTDFSRECARLWVSAHGRRFMTYKPSIACGRKRGPKSGTMAAVARGSKRATDNIIKQVVQANGADRMVFPGIARHELLVRRQQDLPAPTEKLKKFISYTAKRKNAFSILAQARVVARSRRTNPYALPVLNPRLRLRTGHVLTAKPKPELAARKVDEHRGPIVVASCCSGELPPIPGYTIVVPRATDDSNAALLKLSKAQIIVWDYTWQLDGPVSAQHLVSAVVAIGLGKAVLAKPRWRGAHPHRSSSLVHYLPVAQGDEKKTGVVKISLGGELVAKHAFVCAALKFVAGRGKSWQIVPSAEEGAGGKNHYYDLHTLVAVRDFLQRRRRVYRPRAGLDTALLR
jgi:hypothetical protein